MDQSRYYTTLSAYKTKARCLRETLWWDEPDWQLAQDYVSSYGDDAFDKLRKEGPERKRELELIAHELKLLLRTGDAPFYKSEEEARGIAEDGEHESVIAFTPEDVLDAIITICLPYVTHDAKGGT